MFVDDCVILCRANNKAARIIKQVLNHYFTVSGQLVNCQKLSLLFSNGVSSADKKTISQILQIPVNNKMDKYFDCTGIERHKRTNANFDFIRTN